MWNFGFRLVLSIFVIILLGVTCDGDDHFDTFGSTNHLGFRNRKVVQSRVIPLQNSLPVNVSDLDCFVCEQEDDFSCGEEPTPPGFVKTCRDLIPATTDAFGNGPAPAYLCYKKYDPYTKMISRSCQTSGSLPEWLGSSGCTTSRHVLASGKVGTRCICNTATCNGGQMYIPPDSSNGESHHMKLLTVFSISLFVQYFI